MSTSPLTAISPIDGRYNEKTTVLQDYFSEFALIKNRIYTELTWLYTLSLQQNIKEIPKITEKTQSDLDNFINNFTESQAEQVKAIEATTNHDVKAVEYFLKDTFKDHKEIGPIIEFIHFACTSEDINNVAYALMYKSAKEDIIAPSITTLINEISELAKQFSNVPMLARTHGQPATPTTVGKEMANFAARCRTQLKRFSEIPIQAKFNGAVGNYNAHRLCYPEVDWPTLTREMLERLALEQNPYTTQIEPHDWVAEHCHALARINSILIDFCRDIWGYISIGYFKQKVVENEVGSSAMPHKVNPIDFENAEGNLGLSNTLGYFFAQQLPTSRWQRDLVDSTVFRNIGVSIAHAFIAYQSLEKGIGKLSINETKISEDLDNNWEVLAEGIQTMMRKQGIEEPYEKLKALTRGNKIDQSTLTEFIDSLGLPEHEENTLLTLTPAKFTGYAEELANQIDES